MGGGEHLGQPSRGSPLQDLGNRHQLTLVDDGKLRLSAPADDRHHTVPELEALRSGAERGHIAGELQAGNVLR